LHYFLSIELFSFISCSELDHGNFSKNEGNLIVRFSKSIGYNLWKYDCDKTRNDRIKMLTCLHDKNSCTETVSVIACNCSSNSRKSIVRKLLNHVVVIQKIVWNHVQKERDPISNTWPKENSREKQSCWKIDTITSGTRDEITP